MNAVTCSIQKDIRKLIDYYLEVCPDYLGVIAATCAMLLTDSQFNEKEMPDLKGVALAGEVCSRKLIKSLDLMVRQDGLLYYAGRLDNRIKIGGNRVELEEVESAILYDSTEDRYSD